MKINEILHPDYIASISSWLKWRLTYESGDAFVDAYLSQYSIREDMPTYNKRKALTYIPAFAKAAVNDVKNAIFQRAADIKRVNGSKKYQQAISGQLGGVDLFDSSINSFIGLNVLPELLTMAKVGIYVDMHKEIGETYADIGDRHPYIYTFKAEDIRSWCYGLDNKLNKLLLRGYLLINDPITQLPIRREAFYRYFIKGDGRIIVQDYDKDGKEIGGTILLIPEIPFVIVEISQSLLVDIAGYQIALLNLASSDLHYAITSNFPFYTEQFDSRAEASSYLRQASDVNNNENNEAVVDGTKATASTASDKQKIVGVTQGRRYSMGSERPGFIHPSPEPLRISMDKQELMKSEIRELINLSLANIKPKMVSAESRAMENEGLEAGLAAIGMILEASERQIAFNWHMYENTKSDVVVSYPKLYSMKSDSERIAEADKKMVLLVKIPSLTYKKEMAKDVAQLTLGHRIAPDEMEMIFAELDAVTSLSDIDTILKTKELGLLSDKYSAISLGFPAEEAEKGAEDHAKRIARIQETQSQKQTNSLSDGAITGNSDASSGSDIAKNQKELAQNADNNPDGTKKVRGTGRTTKSRRF